MGKKEKLLTRLKGLPKDFTLEEAESLLAFFGYQRSDKGRTSGSRMMFTNGHQKILLHKPHPRKELLAYQVKQLKDQLEQEGLL